MSINFNCKCGKILRVADEHAGRRVKCPACNEVTVARAAVEEPQFEVVEDEPARPIRAKPVAKRDVELDDDDDDRPKKKSRRDDDDDDDDRPRSKRRVVDDDDDDEEEERPRRKKKTKVRRKPKEEKAQHFGMERGIMNSGVAGGLLAMIGAVVWFVLGIMNDRIFIYPPILFVVGFIAFVKGLMGGGDE